MDFSTKSTEGEGSTLGERLRSARVSTGLSTRALADRLSARVKISHATLANYERGDTRPGIDVISAIATELDRPLQWFLQSGLTLKNVRYRHRKSLVTQTACVQFEFAAQTWLDAYLFVEQRLGEPLSRVKKYNVEDIGGRTPEAKAKSVRKMLNLTDQDPVYSVPKTLEAFGIRVIEVPTGEAIDGLAAVFGKERVVVLARGLDGDRTRLNAAHEFGHIVAGDVEAETEVPEAHARAFEFGACLLMPPIVLKRAIQRQSMVHLVEMKKHYGVSLAAMIYRAEKCGFLSQSEAKAIWIEFAKRGWRQSEPGLVSPDRALRFEVLFERAEKLKKVTLEEVSRQSGLGMNELKRRLSEPAGFIDEPVPMIDRQPSQGLRLVSESA
jgi:Zn-dependent peptidase ImmA (M78 family)/transcriptional regulator with XRE-family HTH domain